MGLVGRVTPSGQWSDGRTWYSKSSPPTQISRMIAEIATAQNYMHSSGMAMSATETARMIGQ